MPREIPDLQGNPLARLRWKGILGINPRPVSEAAPVLIAFARHEESRALCRRLAGIRRVRDGSPEYAWGKIGASRVCVAHLGIGPGSAEGAMLDLFPGRSWSHVIVAGFAGALNPNLRLGDTVIEEIPAPGKPRIVSVDFPVETAAAKRVLFEQTGAQAVDMETKTVARVCRGTVPLLSIRVISDEADADLPVPFNEWFDLQFQRPRTIRLLTYLMRNPERAPAFFKFVRAIPGLSEALALAIEGSIIGMEHF